ncbi:alpha-galactosidase [Parasphingopyxis sp. CP4]|uniref:alpha-galactosidase n=1 Tax=Parasphingopyxis sp. CP4 TaxID=2724527 RepID=UPI0015A0F6BB|nr:alpha-galactosidase [Parasphingopyxis sp. CP4]QLC22011.1 alpha-galactosidase [Parasphingopyxis sp. CP4]
MTGTSEYARIDGEGISLVIAVDDRGVADLIYIGAKLAAAEDLATLTRSQQRGRHENQPDIPPVAGLLPESKFGYAGHSAVELRNGADRVQTDFRVTAVRTEGQRLSVTFDNAAPALRINLSWEIRTGPVLVTQLALENRSGHTLAIDRLVSIALPIPARFERLISYSGRWAGEMRESEDAVGPHGFAARSVGGRQGFGGGNWLIFVDAHDAGVLGAHLAWSGDFETFVDRDADGRATLLMSPRLDAGEITLAPGERFETPEGLVALGDDRSRLAQSFHDYARSDVLPGRTEWGPRKVHLNSWEALSFAMDEAKLMALADRAAELGVERFVLDDGWFGGRRNDRSSLGDWTVSPDVLPNGLDPLVAHIEELGMDFGLWVEPEMISADSDLYRAHPDWCLQIPGHEQREQRHQLVLDLTVPGVTDYLFSALDALLSAHRIAYLKWDHNRDLFPAANADGPVGYRQTQALYDLLERLRLAHPDIEIESCASGGGRIDYAILSRCNRIWASDNNDALERLRINRSWSQFLPLEVIGSHVGPSPNPITGRRLDMDFRAKVALFGHMGVEADPGAMDAHDREVLRAHIALYKHWRGLLHSGRLQRLNHQDPGISGLLVTDDQHGLALVAQSGFAESFGTTPIRFAGLDLDATYRVTLPEPWPRKASRYLADRQGWRDGRILSGQALRDNGLALPLTHPETAWLIAFERTHG